MTKSDFIAKVSSKASVEKDVTKEMMNFFVSVLIEELQKGESIQLLGFGTFNVNHKPERIGNHPNTGEKMVIPASRSVSFKAGTKLKSAMKTKLKN
jgi:DNA-binding protein HU-beta